MSQEKMYENETTIRQVISETVNGVAQQICEAELRVAYSRLPYNNLVAVEQVGTNMVSTFLQGLVDLGIAKVALTEPEAAKAIKSVAKMAT